ncbi:hypothetical protein HFD88_009340 [Aspergillus terreus]|nr:hypothetical protein HFD88_009340 [Aspergillus terreus]
MDEYPPPSRLSLCTLPLESRQAILGHLDDLHALKAAILTHSSLYSAFVSHQNVIMYRILSNIIPSGLMNEAICVLNTFVVESEPWTRERVISIIEQQAFQIQDLHHDIELFSSDFISAAQSIKGTGWARPASSLEWSRIVRTFYRFQIHRHLFRKRDRRRAKNKPSPDFSWGEQREIWYSDYPVWELEQLACVSEYLFRKIAIPFNEIAAHDVDWGFRGVGFGYNEAWEAGTCRIGTLLSQGLSFLAKVIRAKSYEERYRLLTPNVRLIAWFLPEELPDLFHTDVDETVLLKDYTAEQLKSLEGSKRSDADPGPAEAWHHTHLELGRLDFVGSDRVRELRRWGYVMWDYARLVEMGGLDSPVVLSDPLPHIPDFPRQDRVVESLVTRRKLYWRGARGWWAEGDESRLEWERPSEVSDEETDIAHFKTRIFF